MATNNLVKKGQCINFGNCNKANAKEIIEVNFGDEFVCHECGFELVEIKNTPPSSKKLIIIAAAALIIIAGIVLFFVFSGGNNGGEEFITGPGELIVE